VAAGRRTRSVSPEGARNYLKKAEEFAASMEQSLEEGRWNAAALSAVHAAISAGDAMLAAFVGIRSADEDHRQIVSLLSDHLGEEGDKMANHVQRVVARKNLVEYEERLVKETDAVQMAGHVRRLLQQIREKFG
jgi:HEPN domain-containing protein